MSKAEKAKELFMQEEYNCAQAVFGAYADDFGLNKELALTVSACFGGGLGRQREVCGAVSGMCMALALRYAPKDPKDHAQKAAFYTRIQEVCNRFKEENGSIICRELLNLSAGTPQSPVPEKRTAAYYQHRTCAGRVESAAAILEKYFEENK